MINPSMAEGYHRFAPESDRLDSRRQRNSRQRAGTDEFSLLGWFEAHKNLVSKIGLLACIAFYGLTVFYGVIAGGHWVQLRQNLAQATNGAAISAGFAVTAVRIEGRQNLKEAEIAKALGSFEDVSIFSFDTVAARDELKANGWVAEARVTRFLPSTLIVELEEHEPFALWSEGGKTAVVDIDGKVLALASREEFPDLPVVAGPGAASPAKDILRALRAVPELKARVQTIERVAGRRWDLVLDTGLRAKLPSRRYIAALADLSLLATKNPGAFYEMSEMDFRVPSQFTIRLKDESDIGRQKFLSWLTGGKASHTQGL